MRRIGILGGTFNPIHIAHLAMAQVALEKMNLEKVIFIPCNIPPHKSVSQIASSVDRFNMVSLAIDGNPFFEVSDFEIKKEETSYTIDTLRHFQQIYNKGSELYFIIGGDLLPQLKKWRYIGDILKIATFIVVNRPGQFKKAQGIRYVVVSMPGIDISSSYVRRCIAQGKTVKYFVSENVAHYIQKHKLYLKR